MATTHPPADEHRRSDLEETARKLWWLTDVPTFMDDRLVDRLYGAIIRPEFILLQRSETAERTRSETSSSSVEGGGEVSFPAFWKVSAKASTAEEAGEGVTRGTQVTKQFVHTPERRLQDLITHYGSTHPDRLLFDECGQSKLRNLMGDFLDWDEAVALLDIPGPRPLVFIELDRLVPIMPMAGGTEAGMTVILSASMIEEMHKRGKAIPDFPADDDPDAQEKKTGHWNALMRHYDNREAMRIVDHGFGADHRIEWIDFRLKVNTRARPIHIHFAAAGLYLAGEFAYYVVRRGFKEGLRLVGRLKRGCDINVISLYER
jgi:hypothetical protein